MKKKKKVVETENDVDSSKGKRKGGPGRPRKQRPSISPPASPQPKKKRMPKEREVETPYVGSTYRPKGPGSNLLDKPPNITRPETPPLNLDTISQTLKEKNITPSPLKFGFLGLGIMGSGNISMV